MTPATAWSKPSVDPASYGDSLPGPFPSIGGARITEDYFADFMFEAGLIEVWFEAPPTPDAWTEASVAATSFTEASVAASSWTESSL